MLPNCWMLIELLILYVESNTRSSLIVVAMGVIGSQVVEWLSMG